MNILFLSQIVPYPPHGGVLQRGFNIVRELGRRHEVHLLAFVHPDTLTTPGMIDESRRELGKLCASIKYFPLWPKRNRFLKTTALLAGAVWPVPFSVLAHRSGEFGRAVGDFLRTRRADIVHFDTIGLAQYNDPALRCATVVTHHNVESKLMERRAAAESASVARWYAASQARKLRAYEARQSPRFDVNIVMSALDGDDLRAIAPNVETAIVPNGVDTEYFVPRPGEETPALIYTGGMNMFANRDAVLYFLEHAWPAIKAAMPETIFYVVGQDPPADLRRLATPESGIVVTGYVSDVRPYVAKSSVYIVPLRVGGGTRLKVVDAMAQGKAIVSTSVGCEGIDVTPDRNIVVADAPAQFAERVIALLRAPAERARLGNAARAFVESRYAWPVIGETLNRAYTRAVELGARRRGAN